LRKASNPLAETLGLPSAVFIETVYGMAGIELTPGLSCSARCPEAIWQAQTTHDENAAQQVPEGKYAIPQKAAAADWPPENH
jgi:hypothetical protein